MKYTRITALAAVSLAATLSLTACGSDNSGQDSSSKGTSDTSASDTSATGSSATGSSASGGGSKSEAGSGSGSEAGTTKSGSGQGTEAETTSNGATTTGGKATFCKTKDLAIDAAPDAADPGRVNITMINRGATTCSATGFAGVDIKDEDHTSNPIERGHAQPRITTLKPGDAAVFDIAYTVLKTGNSLSRPTNILVTPPNETHTVTLNWPEGAGAIKGAYTDVEVYPTHTTK
ncbi:MULTISPECIES: DUF4232 domain-containing protein [unclassified Streptomyces]|uniref:DUF4232 domain-containing protein n=1 Tax=unclassified Streptomyces TaxID=2593676 RepID=UPI002E0EAC49|nr:DUF4232 domain-containing protein [Streptomyces sp. NBC_01197]WSS49969.1 DUF4232 domain-containing protein [Streptomyces sp. NBC_01180]